MIGKRGSIISAREGGSRVSDMGKVVAELMTRERVAELVTRKG